MADQKLLITNAQIDYLMDCIHNRLRLHGRNVVNSLIHRRGWSEDELFDGYKILEGLFSYLHIYTEGDLETLVLGNTDFMDEYDESGESDTHGG